MQPRITDTVRNTQKKVVRQEPIVEKTIFKAPAAATVETKKVENSENTIKIHTPSGHTLVLLKRTRVKGFCVRCIKKQNDPQYKTKLTKVTTYCPQCPGGAWICEKCFDEFH